jgi:hypothetical protein
MQTRSLQTFRLQALKRTLDLVKAITNEDEKKPMTEAQKEAFRAATTATTNQAAGDHHP